MDFMNAMSKTWDEQYNYSTTENGALGYSTTQNPLVDMNYKVSSYRNRSDDEIIKDFFIAFNYDKVKAMRWLFYVRDVREGLGERRLFRVIIKYLCSEYSGMIKDLLPLFSEYGRWDDIFEVIPYLRDYALDILKCQLVEDLENYSEGKPISLLAKWMPSQKSKRKDIAVMFCNYAKISPKEYRKMLSKLRSYIDVVEVKMSRREWDKIDYSTVPSRANLIYNKAFIRHDEGRRKEYLDKAVNGEVKINSSVLYPHDIVHKYTFGDNMCSIDINDGLEAMWSQLKSYHDMKNTIVVRDGSYSMTSRVDNKSRVTAMDVATALSIYFGERCTGCFKDKIITFSNYPKIVDFSKADTLHDKIQIIGYEDEVSNTNIYKVFKLILDTAMDNNMSQKDIPERIVIMSDMEFDMCASSSINARLFDEISNMYENAGYKLPKLIFWNICGRTNTIPMKSNELGVALVSGFSTNIADMIMSDKLDPAGILMEAINSERYQAVEDIVKKFTEV